MTDQPRCPVHWDEYAGDQYYHCSLEAGHDGIHRAHVSDDLTRAYVVMPDDPQAPVT
jgi:hypothetical protein